MLNRRTFSVASAAAVMGRPAWAQTETLRIVVGFPAGGVVDVVAREVAEGLKAALGRPVIVENRPGAGGRLGVMAVKGAAADGKVKALLEPFAADPGDGGQCQGTAIAMVLGDE